MRPPGRPLLPLLLALATGCPRPTPLPAPAPPPAPLGTEVVVWRRDLGAALNGEPLLVDGVLWLGDDAGTVHALEAASGRVLFTAPLRPDAFLPILARPTLGGGQLFVADAGGLVAALDPYTGARRWAVDLHGELRAPPVWEGDTLWVASAEFGILALDAATGEERWRRVSQQRWHALDLVEPDQLCALGFTTPADDELRLCLDRRDGRERSREPTARRGLPPAAAVSVCGDRVTVEADGAVLGSEATSGAPRWRHAPLAKGEAQPARGVTAAGALALVRAGTQILAISPPSCPTGALAPQESSR